MSDQSPIDVSKTCSKDCRSAPESEAGTPMSLHADTAVHACIHTPFWFASAYTGCLIWFVRLCSLAI